jgi:hypothetical protein
MSGSTANLISQLETATRVRVKKRLLTGHAVSLVAPVSILTGSSSRSKSIILEGVPVSADAVLLEVSVNNTSGSASLAIIKARCDPGAPWTILAQTVNGSAQSGQCFVPLSRPTLWRTGSPQIDIQVTGACSYTVKVIGYLE